MQLQFWYKRTCNFSRSKFRWVSKRNGITVVTSVNNKLQSKALLEKFNFPFIKKGATNGKNVSS